MAFFFLIFLERDKKKKKPAGENWLLVDSRGENLYMDGDWG